MRVLCVMMLLLVGVSGCLEPDPPVRLDLLQSQAAEPDAEGPSETPEHRPKPEPQPEEPPEPEPANGTAPAEDNQTAPEENATEPQGGYTGFDGEPEDCTRVLPPGPLQADAGVVTGYQTRVLDVAVAVDASFVTRHGEDWRETVDFIMRMADDVYRRELQLEVNVVAVVPIPAGDLEVVENTESTLRGDLSQAILDDTRAYFDAHHDGLDRDLVYTLVGTATAGAIAGQAECIGGARYKDAAYGWGEALDVDDGTFAGPVGLWAYDTVKVILHEMAHILGAHHHYQTCGVELLLSGPGDLLGACSIMTNAVDLASFYFSPLNKMAIRGYAESVDL